MTTPLGFTLSDLDTWRRNEKQTINLKVDALCSLFLGFTQGRLLELELFEEYWQDSEELKLLKFSNPTEGSVPLASLQLNKTYDPMTGGAGVREYKEHLLTRAHFHFITQPYFSGLTEVLRQFDKYLSITTYIKNGYGDALAIQDTKRSIYACSDKAITVSNLVKARIDKVLKAEQKSTLFGSKSESQIIQDEKIIVEMSYLFRGVEALEGAIRQGNKVFARGAGYDRGVSRAFGLWRLTVQQAWDFLAMSGEIDRTMRSFKQYIIDVITM